MGRWGEGAVGPKFFVPKNEEEARKQAILDEYMMEIRSEDEAKKGSGL